MKLIRIEGDSNEEATRYPGGTLNGHCPEVCYIDPDEVVGVFHGVPYGGRPHTDIWLRGARNAIVVQGTMHEWVDKLRTAAEASR